MGNSSTDIEMLQACRNEFQKRLKAYYNWKTKYENKSAAVQSKNTEVVSNILQQTDTKSVQKSQVAQAAVTEKLTAQPAQPAPKSSSSAAAAGGPPREKKKKKKKVSKDRYFRIPFTRPGKSGKNKKKGLWWAHFEGQKIKRQLETHPH